MASLQSRFADHWMLHSLHMSLQSSALLMKKACTVKDNNSVGASELVFMACRWLSILCLSGKYSESPIQSPISWH